MKHAVFCGTRNLYTDMETAAKSLVANSSVDRIHFVIEDAEFPRPLPDFVECHDASGQRWFDFDGPNARKKWTWMVLMRAALCHVLPDVDTVLSLDCDTVCRRNVDAIWELPVDDCYYAAVTEQGKSKDGLQYANLGVALFNLGKLRDGKADEAIGVLNSREYTWPEQDVMNYLCQGRICEMPKKFNDMWFNGPESKAAITHFAATKREAWERDPDVVLYRSMTWDDALAAREYAGKGTVAFATNHSLERDESIRAVWDAYKGPKRLVRPVEAIANVSGCPVVVVDTLTPYVPNKDFKLVNVGHGIAGGKLYGRNEQRAGIDARALAQTDYIVTSSTKTVCIAASEFGVPKDRVLPIGFPRSDMLVGKSKGDGGTFLAKFGRAYLYAPTFRGKNDGEKLPDIDWRLLDSLLDDDEILAVKRHYFTGGELAGGGYSHIVELPCDEGSAPYLIDCDVLMTDYSSIVFDGYVAGKPCALLTDDMDSYMATRGMYLDYPAQYSSRWLEAEGNEKELVVMLREAAKNGIGDVERECLAYVADMCDGHAAERVCELIRGLL